MTASSEVVFYRLKAIEFDIWSLAIPIILYIISSQGDFDQNGEQTEQPIEKKREKKVYQRTMTPGTLRNALQDRLRSNMDTAHLAGTLKSLDEEDQNTNNENEEMESQRERESLTKSLSKIASLPRHMRRHSRDEDFDDKNDIDAENIETPPATRRAIGNRSFKSPSNGWDSQPVDEDDEFEKRRLGRKFRSMTSHSRKALVGEAGVDDKMRLGASDGEGDTVNPRISTQRLMKFKKLSDLAKEGDSETEQMLFKQKKSDAGDDLGDGNFQRFSSVRKTLRHKRGDKHLSEDRESQSADKNSEGRRSSEKELLAEPAEEKLAGEVVAVQQKVYSNIHEPTKSESIFNSGEDKDSRLKRWQKLRDYKLDGDDVPAESSLKGKITRKFFPSSDKYDLAKASKTNSQLDDLKPPSSERLQRKAQDSFARGTENRGSFKSLSPSLAPPSSSRTRRGDRTRSAIDPSQVREALDRNSTRSRLAKDSNRRKIESRNGSLKGRSGSKEDKDEGFEDTISLKSETASQENSSANGELADPKRSTGSSSRNSDIIEPNQRNDKSSSHGSLRSSRSSLTSGTSVNTVRQAKQLSKSPSNASVASNRSDTSTKSKSRLSDYSSPFKSITKSLRKGLAASSDPTSPHIEDDQPCFRSDRSRSSLFGSRPVSRNDSIKSVGSLSKHDGSIRKTPVRSSSNASTMRLTNGSAKRPLAPVQPKAATLNSRNISLNRTSNSAPSSTTKVKRGDSGSSKENLSRSNSGNSRTEKNTPRNSTSREKVPAYERLSSSRSPSKSSSYTTMGSLTRRTPPASGARSSRTLPAFMRPTTSSTSKHSETQEPVKKVRVSSKTLTPSRLLVK